MAKEPEQISCQESENEFEDDFFSDKVIASLEFTNTHIIVVERLSKYTSGFDSFFSSSLSMEKREKYLDDELESKSTGQLTILKLRH